MKKTLLLSLFIIIGFVLTACNSPKAKERTVFPSDCCHADADLGDDWIPVWCDEFDGDSIDLTKWNIEDTIWYGNEELQYYSPNNIFIEDGKLVIEARKESFGGRDYTSGRMDSKEKGDWLYGRVIVRAKMPSGRGTWPAIWMMPTESAYGGWPHSGEIDIMEYVGYDQNRMHGHFHTSKYNWLKGNNVGASILLTDVEETFHNYEMIWEPGIINLYVDGEPLVTYEYIASNEQNVLYHQVWPFDQAFHLILNLAIGGGWGGVQGIDDDAFPTRFEIDYVRVYQRDYPYIDTQVPKSIETIYKGQGSLKALIYWDVPEDDYGIEYYEIYIDGNLHGTATVNSFFVTGLLPRTIYRLQVVAVDFAGNKSELMPPIEYSYG